MALNPETRFAGKIAPADAEYPYGKARNITVPNDGTGTPFVADLVNDIFGFQQALLDRAGLVPSGDPDHVGDSQYLNALKKIFPETHIDAGPTPATNLGYNWYHDGSDYRRTAEGGASRIEFEGAEAGVAGAVNIYKADSDSADSVISWDLVATFDEDGLDVQGEITKNGGQTILPAPETRQVFSSPGLDSWVRPAGCKRVKIEVVSGGGAGGGCDATASGTPDEASVGGGGGSGGYAVGYLDVTSIPSAQVSVGAGGVGSVSANGGFGLGSRFGPSGSPYLEVDVGGFGGSYTAATAASITASGSPGGGTFAGSASDILGFEGNSGGTGFGGGSGGDGFCFGGNGGAGYNGGGSGGAVVPSPGGSEAGNSGSAPGAGGSGAASISGGGSAAGGDGADGIVIVTEYYH